MPPTLKKTGSGVKGTTAWALSLRTLQNIWLCWAVQGPRAMETMQKLTTADLSAIPYYSFVTARFAGVENVIISNTGYTGAGGFELYFYPEEGRKIWDALLKPVMPMVLNR